MKVVFLAHPLRGDVPGNMARAKRWYRWACSKHEGEIAVVATWLVDVEMFDDSDEGQRRAGIDRNLTVLERCDELWLTGGKVTGGMKEEMFCAQANGLRIRDLTHLGEEPPND